MDFGFIMFVIAAIFVLGLYCIAARIHKYKFFKTKGGLGVFLSWAIPSVIAIAVLIIGGATNLVVVFLHAWAILGFCCLVSYIIKKIRKKAVPRFITDIAALSLTIIYLFVGWMLMVNVSRTEYTIETQKNIGRDLRIVQITDLHLGMINAEDVAELVERINTENPHMVVITGDFVDDESKKEDMLAACEALGQLKVKYGTFFVFGNHDKGYHEYRDFSKKELKKALTENGIDVLEDEAVVINQRIYVVGRKDASELDRKPMSELMKGLAENYYSIILDHQPNDYDAQEEAKVDLVLSGHTHGGHVFPAGPVGVLIGANDAYYGLETRNNTNFIISSGVSAWEIPFKTFNGSEYVVIDVKYNKDK